MNRIRSERALMGLTQKDLADMVGVDRSTIVRWESGDSLTQDNIVKMHDIFGCTADWLLGLVDERIPTSRGASKRTTIREGPSNVIHINDERT